MGTLDPLTGCAAEVVWSDSTAVNRGWVSKPKRVRKRASWGGVRQRLKRQGHRCVPLPTVMLANVQSLCNKLDELWANVKSLRSTAAHVFLLSWKHGLSKKIFIQIWKLMVLGNSIGWTEILL